MKLKPPGIGSFVIGVCAVAALMLVLTDWSSIPPSTEVLSAGATLLLLALLSEAGAFKVKRLATSTTSIGFIPCLAAVILIGPGWAMVVTGLNFFVAEAFLRRKPLIKVAYNSAKEIIAIGLSAHVYLALGGAPSLVDFRPAVVAFAATVLVFFPVDHAGTAIAIALTTRTRVREAWGRLTGGQQFFDFGASFLSFLLAFLYVSLGVIGALMVVIPLLLVRHVYGLAMRFEQVNRDLLVLMVKSIEARDPYTSGHSVRVSRLARIMAEELGLSAREIDQVATAGLLHDVGKIYQEYAPILRKEGRLEDREIRLMRSHPVKGAELIGTVASLRGEVQSAVRHHHEAFGGRGYPDRLAGQEIPLAARIIAVVDTFDAMTTTRPYRAALSRRQASEELQAMVGRQFDPKIVDVFCTNERIAAVIDEALRERPGAPEDAAVETHALLDEGVGEPDSLRFAKRRRWVPRPSMGHLVDDLSSEDEREQIA